MSSGFRSSDLWYIWWPGEEKVQCTGNDINLDPGGLWAFEHPFPLLATLYFPLFSDHIPLLPLGFTLEIVS